MTNRVNLCRWESCFTVCLQVCRVSHFLARNDPRYVTEKSSTARCKIHRMDKICLELGTFEEFATAVLQTVLEPQLSPRTCMHSLMMVSFTCLKKDITCSDKHLLDGYSLQHSCCKFLKSTKLEVKLIHAMDFTSVELSLCNISDYSVGWDWCVK